MQAKELGLQRGIVEISWDTPRCWAPRAVLWMRSCITLRLLPNILPPPHALSWGSGLAAMSSGFSSRLWAGHRDAGSRLGLNKAWPQDNGALQADTVCCARRLSLWDLATLRGLLAGASSGPQHCCSRLSEPQALSCPCPGWVWVFAA